jgi:hypothetical protein
MYNLNYARTTLEIQSSRENISGSMRTKKVEYHCSRPHIFKKDNTKTCKNPAVTH